jgi:hypothetical protein
MMGDMVCIDTHVLMWGVQEYATDGQEEMIDRTKRFLRWLEGLGTQILIPTPIIAEFLMDVPSKHHATITNLLEANFIVAPFDTQAASYFARMWQEKRDQGVIDEMKAAGKTREVIKFDAMFVSIAVARKAARIYSQDHNGVAKFAAGYIDVDDIPDIPEQPNLPRF